MEAMRFLSVRPLLAPLVFCFVVSVLPASDDVLATPIPFEQFTDNILEGRYALGDEDVTITGFGGGSIPMQVAIWILVRLVVEVYGSGDPQQAFLFDRFSVDGTDITASLVHHATLPENIVSTTSLPGLLGGSTFMASRAFSGVALDEQGTEISGVSVGFGVFETFERGTLFSPVLFATTVSDFARIDNMHLDLGPVLSDSFTGFFEAHGTSLVAAETPEPSTIALIVAGTLVGLAMGRRRSV